MTNAEIVEEMQKILKDIFDDFKKSVRSTLRDHKKNIKALNKRMSRMENILLDVFECKDCTQEEIKKKIEEKFVERGRLYG